MKSYRLFVISVDVWGMKSLNVEMESIAKKAVNGEIGCESPSSQWCQGGTSHVEAAVAVEDMVEGEEEVEDEVMDLMMK
jgi:predicted glycosyl hydrolase (DUF1957 family)